MFTNEPEQDSFVTASCEAFEGKEIVEFRSSVEFDGSAEFEDSVVFEGALCEVSEDEDGVRCVVR